MVHFTGPHREAPGSGRRLKKQRKAGVKVLIVDYHGTIGQGRLSSRAHLTKYFNFGRFWE